MGVTIHYRLGSEEQYVKGIVDRVHEFAKQLKKEAKILKIPFQITRFLPTRLRIDIGGCESLIFDFNPYRHYSEKEGWNYQKSTLEDFKFWDTNPDEPHYKKYPGQIMYWAAGFCKTQYANNIAEHKFVAELIRVASAYCKISEVSDEGDYYHSGKLEDAAGSIEENGKMISNLFGVLQDKGFSPDQIIKGGETTIKKAKKV